MLQVLKLEPKRSKKNPLSLNPVLLLLVVVLYFTACLTFLGCSLLPQGTQTTLHFDKHHHVGSANSHKKVRRTASLPETYYRYALV